MNNKLLIVILVVILLGVAVGAPLYVLGGQKTELKDTIAELIAANAELIAANAELQTTAIDQINTIFDLETSNETLQLKEDAQNSLILEYQQAVTEQGNSIDELGARVESLEQIVTALQNNISSLETQLQGQYDVNTILQGQKTQLEERMEGLETVIGELRLALIQAIELNIVQTVMVAVMASNNITLVQALSEDNRTNDLSAKPLASDGGALTYDFSDFLVSTDTNYWYYWTSNGIVGQSITAP